MNIKELLISQVDLLRDIQKRIKEDAGSEVILIELSQQILEIVSFMKANGMI